MHELEDTPVHKTLLSRGSVIHTDATSSSAKKGETLEASVAVLSSYSDVVVLRHPGPGAVDVPPDIVEDQL
ncbi:hypothetical protein MSG28_014552 [Choristoneura fumiferana]|uniref:Uncharacterized protein n=1 Tax=Choristoneura fumiferana TaxID=7141 RepID=A0ACC0JS92_CHOFU|nr:hypothetical protein MSG28_014552 [Choristoneura fumiferana]